MKKLLVLALALSVMPAFAADAPAPKRHWSFEGAFGTYDRGALQRGFKVYKDVCAACHGLSQVSFHDLTAPGGPGFSEAQARAIASTFKLRAEPNEKGATTDASGNPLLRRAALSDHIPSPFANEAAARVVNGGLVPPDLSLIVNARPGGADYVFALLTGYHQRPPQGFAVPEGLQYNPQAPNRLTAMTAPLVKNSVVFADGTPATVENEAAAVTEFLAWASDPSREARHRLGLQVMAYMALLSTLLFLCFRKVWKKPEVDVAQETSPEAAPEITAPETETAPEPSDAAPEAVPEDKA